MQKLKDIIKELTEIVKLLNKLAVEIIGLIGWLLIIIKMFN